MNRHMIKDTFGWGVLLWLFGYILGIIFFMLVPVWLVGWIIMPIGTVVTLWVLLKKMKQIGCCDPFDPKLWQNHSIIWKKVYRNNYVVLFAKVE